eukprot:3404933-Amphidinium_carterae.1
MLWRRLLDVQLKKPCGMRKLQLHIHSKHVCGTRRLKLAGTQVVLKGAQVSPRAATYNFYWAACSRQQSYQSSKSQMYGCSSVLPGKLLARVVLDSDAEPAAVLM